MNIHDNPELMKLIRDAWNDGYSAAISNALDADLISQDSADELLDELTN